MSISEPSKIPVPFADIGLKNTIPAASDNTTGKAGFDKGFPERTMLSKAAGGIPPSGMDFNGILYDITSAVRYMQAGGRPTYDAVFAAAIGGYPAGAVLISNDGSSVFQNTAAGNVEDPNSGGAGWARPDLQVMELYRRSYAEAGYSVVDGSFEVGGTISSAAEALIHEASGKTYSWEGALPKNVPAGSTPDSTGGVAAGAWHDVTSAQSTMSDYSGLRAYRGESKSVYITGVVGTAKPEGVAGRFAYDATDTTSADNGGTIIVDTLGRRWVRQDLRPVNIEWFGADVSKTDNLTHLTAAMSYCKTSGRAFYVPGKGVSTYKFSGTLFPNGVIMFGDGEMDSRLEYTGTGTALRGDDTTIGGAIDQALFDFGFRDIYLSGPGKAVAGTIGIDGNLYRTSIDNYTIIGFEMGMQPRGAIIQIGRGRISACKWPLIVRPYKDCTPTTTAVISASADNCDFGLWVDHEFSATPVWPQTSGSGGAAAIVFRDTVIEKCTGTAYIVNRASHIVFDNCYEEQNGKSYDIVSSVNPTFLRTFDGFGSAAGTIVYTGLAEVDQGYTSNERYGTVLPRLLVGGPNAKGGAGDPFVNTVAGRGIRAYLSGCAAFVKDAAATTPDAFWIGNTATPKKYVLTIDDTSNHWLRLNSYTDAGAFSKTGFVFDQINGRWGFGSGQVNTAFLASFNGHIGPLFDNIFDYGSAAFRGRVAYFGTGTINTSDAREKTAPKDITDLVLDAADSIEIVLFQWLDAIREKGLDGARWHFGAIAQQIRDAFAERGLDGTEYGLLCYDSWEDVWEDVIEEVVEHVPVEKEDGTIEVIRTSKFEATGERRLKLAAGDRWGVRPDQCHWLLLAAARRRAVRAEQRLADIERRLTAAGM